MVDLYRRAGVLASASAREGGGMSIAEAASCATPAVATRIAGHLDAVDEGRSGILVAGRDELVGAHDQMIRAPDLRSRLRGGALERAAHRPREATALAGVAAPAAVRCRAPPL